MYIVGGINVECCRRSRFWYNNVNEDEVLYRREIWRRRNSAAKLIKV